MELIMISSSKLKIMLSPDDMQKYSLDTDVNYSDTKTRRAFKAILEEAKQKTGFDAESEKIFIQLYPSKKGGCEVYITKIEEDSDCAELSLKLYGDSRSTRKGGSTVKKAPRECLRAYSFTSLDCLISVCRRLKSLKWKGQSSVYNENGRFYILLRDKYGTDNTHIDRLAFIAEYGEKENHERLSRRLSEHAFCICASGAVEKLGLL